ncbi:uncharacterized protein LOC129002653 [Macrosteles quadrilineatus]|uniref:uncharacterized protein LOC129002653 n=1 Tax=Macrosteles quadrilineatus TaxID=74068 RepID=UPI0023E31E4D|nr:uncharacterized protein LOC129002653 [Macrosteles quadrilineatus]XP_054286601.1 uncharacterized protein LOC129002653 [Macrosteles quadrilineatus]
MDDGEVILIAPDNKNQDGSQTYFILDPCSSEDCVDGPTGIELIDLTDDYKVKNTGAIAVVSTSSSGALEITLKKPKEEMDPKNLSEMEEIGWEVTTNSESDPIIDMITDDDTVHHVKDEEDVDVEEITIHDPSDKSKPKGEPELIDISEAEEVQQESQNDQDDDPEEDVLFIDDAKYTELQDEVAPESMQELNNLKEHVIQQIEGKREEDTTNKVSVNSENATLDDSGDVKIINVIENKGDKLENVITMSFDIVSGPVTSKTLNQTVNSQEAIVHGQVFEIPSENKNVNENEKELTDSTNTALTLLELAGSTGATLTNIDIKSDNILISDSSSVQENNAHVEDTEIDPNEPTLTTLQPVQLDTPMQSTITSETSFSKASDAQCAIPNPSSKTKTDVSSAPKTPISRTSDDVLQRLRDGDTPRQLMGKESGRRGRDVIYMSPMVTQAEIAQEFMDRQLQKNPYTEPTGGDYLFAMKLTHRLATKIAPSGTTVQQPEETTNETKEDGDITANSQKSLSSENTLKPISNTEIVKEAKKNYAISDKIELLKILEDDPDDPISSTDESQIVLEQKVKSDRKRLSNAPLIRMNPELEKELALKQLQDFSQGSERGKKKVSFSPDRKIKLEKGQERNNNLNSLKKTTNVTRKRRSDILAQPFKKIKKEAVKSVNAAPQLITETLIVEGQAISDDPSTKDSKSLKQYSNKRLSRSSETPPRHLPMDIVLNGIDDLPTEGSSTNKIFKATNPRKRKAELQEKRQKQIANVFQTNKPQKRRGRPPKRKPYPTNDELNKEFLLKATLETNNGLHENNLESPNQSTIPPDAEEKPIKTKKMREIERLLGDEGAINMLYSIEQKRASGGDSKRGMLPSYRRKKRDLILKTKLVKSAVLRQTTNSPHPVGRLSLRGQTPKEEVKEEESSEKAASRKMSVDSHDSHHSLSSPPPEAFPFPAKIVPAEASRIIRRHSSSSNYSSRSNSPRRQSVDGERTIITSPGEKNSEAEQIDSSFINNSKQKPVKSPQHLLGKSIKSPDNKSERETVDKAKESNNKELTPQTTPAIESKKTPMSLKNTSKLADKVEIPRRGRRRIFMTSKMKNHLQLNTSLAAAVEDFAKENKSGGKNIPVETPKKLSTSAVPTSKAVYKKASDKVRTPKSSKVYKELTLKRHDRVVEISLTPVSTKLQNAFNVNVLQELTSVLTGLAKDENCRVVLITSQGPVFCQGVDFPALIKPTPEQRKGAALAMVVAIKELVKSVAVLSRPLVAAVHAPSVGLGVTLLPLCDMVLADQNATFHTPYTRLGHVPEGAATLTFPSLLGPVATSELLFACRKFTSSEAQQAGLVTRVLPSENFHEEILAIAKSLSTHSAQAMNETKMLLRHSLLMGLETTLVSEAHLLTKHWVTAECQANFTSALDKGEYVLAAPSTSTSGESSIKDGPK